MTAHEVVQGYRMKPVATFAVRENRFDIEITDATLAGEERCIYAFVVGDEIVRVGSSKARLATRLGAWRRDVTAALQSRRSLTPKLEADGWREFCKTEDGIVYARAGTMVTTPVGEVSAYLAEEAALIERHRPRFCKR